MHPPARFNDLISQLSKAEEAADASSLVAQLIGVWDGISKLAHVVWCASQAWVHGEINKHA